MILKNLYLKIILSKKFFWKRIVVLIVGEDEEKDLLLFPSKLTKKYIILLKLENTKSYF